MQAEERISPPAAAIRVHQLLQRRMTTPPATAEMERLLLLVSSLRRENEMAHQLLSSYRQLFSSTREVLNRRLPLHKTKAKVTNTCDKAAIMVMVAELDKLERLYSPHKVPTEGDERVRGSLCDEVDVPGLGQEGVCTQGSFRTAEVDVPGLGQGGGCTRGSLRTVEEDVPRLGQGGGHTNGSPYPAVDWDNIARLSLTREKRITLSMPESTLLPVHACSPTPILHTDEYPRPEEGLFNEAFVQRKEEIRQEMMEIRRAAQKTYNPMGGSYTPPSADAVREPFGSIAGFRTNLGPIAFPKGPVKGYVWDQDHSWVLFATPPGSKRRGARGLRR